VTVTVRFVFGEPLMRQSIEIVCRVPGLHGNTTATPFPDGGPAGIWKGGEGWRPVGIFRPSSLSETAVADGADQPIVT
jgi:hypothetical protein